MNAYNLCLGRILFYSINNEIKLLLNRRNCFFQLFNSFVFQFFPLLCLCEQILYGSRFSVGKFLIKLGISTPALEM